MFLAGNNCAVRLHSPAVNLLRLPWQIMERDDSGTGSHTLQYADTTQYAWSLASQQPIIITLLCKGMTPNLYCSTPYLFSCPSCDLSIILAVMSAATSSSKPMRRVSTESLVLYDTFQISALKIDPWPAPYEREIRSSCTNWQFEVGTVYGGSMLKLPEYICPLGGVKIIADVKSNVKHHGTRPVVVILRCRIICRTVEWGIRTSRPTIHATYNMPSGKQVLRRINECNFTVQCDNDKYFLVYN